MKKPTPYSQLLSPYPRESRGAAFTLIETALAMLAIGLGLLAFFGLGRLSLQSAKESLNDQRCGMLASSIFETLREYNTYFVDVARTNEQNLSWSRLWANAITNTDTQAILFPPVAGLSLPETQTNIVFGKLATAYDPNHFCLSSWNPRYSVSLAAKDISRVGAGVNLLEVRLWLYPDGDTFSSEARLYTATLSNDGGLP